MTDDVSNPDLATAGRGDFVQARPPELKRRILAAVLSAVVPGAGQIFLGRRIEGTALLLLSVGLMSCVWPLRLIRFLLMLGFVVLAWLLLACYSTVAAVFRGGIQPSPKPRKWWLLAILPMAYLGFNLIFTLFFLGAGFRARKFDSSAMQPTLLIGDQFILDKGLFRHHSPARQDLVVVHRKDFDTVKRVIAIGGDTIVAKDRNVIVNGKFLDEPFVQHTLATGTDPELDTFGPIFVPKGKYFVMGDNRDVSLDSRMPDFGLVDGQVIIGKPLYVYRSKTKGHLGKLN